MNAFGKRISIIFAVILGSWALASFVGPSSQAEAQVRSVAHYERVNLGSNATAYRITFDDGLVCVALREGSITCNWMEHNNGIPVQ